MDTDQIKNILERYSNGTCTAKEKALIEEWLAEVDIHGNESVNDDFIDQQLKITRRRLDAIIGRESGNSHKRSFNFLFAAAAILILIGAAAAVWSFVFKGKRDAQLTSQPRMAQHTEKGWVIVETSKAQTGNIKLPDGSFVTLDASSILRYPVHFVNHKRPVYLDEGEAFFEVAKDKTSPFTVYTNKFATTALGTAFNIRSYASEHKVSISLIHGKIRVDDLQPAANRSRTRILLPHQQLVLNKLSDRILKADFKDETPVTAWRNGVLSFSDASMDEVMNSISNRFNVQVINKSLRTNWSYTGSFKDEGLTDVLKTICLTEGISCTINDKTVTFN